MPIARLGAGFREWIGRVPVRIHIPERWRDASRHFLKDWALTVLLGVAALLASAKVGEDVFSHETGTFDGAIQRWVAAHQSSAVSSIFLAITYVGSVGMALATAAAAAAWLWRQRGRHVAAATLIAPAVATALFVLVKRIYARARPPIIGHRFLGTYAFPSGHATATTAVWCTLAYICWREGLASRRQ